MERFAPLRFQQGIRSWHMPSGGFARSRHGGAPCVLMLLNFLIIPQETVGSNPDGQASHGKLGYSPLVLFRCAGFCVYRETLPTPAMYLGI